MWNTGDEKFDRLQWSVPVDEQFRDTFDTRKILADMVVEK